jgi:catechol 2,3-dioxygenase-like lactoylglutathione lyase family enzyme
MPESVSGGCLCGAVRFRVTPPTLFCAHCHCSMCRRNHGAAYVTWFGIARERLALEAGPDVLVRHQSSEHGTRSFCGRCGSSLFCESARQPDHVDVVLASLDGPIDRAPSLHVYFDSRAAWTDVRDELPRLGGASGLEPLPGLQPEPRPGVCVGHVFLSVPDVEKTGAFFAALGMRELERTPEFALYELRGGTHLLLFPGEPPAAGTFAPFDLMVDDLDAAHARSAAAGLAPGAIDGDRTPHHRSFTLAAPSGHVLLVQSSHVSGKPV